MKAERDVAPIIQRSTLIIKPPYYPSTLQWCNGAWFVVAKQISHNICRGVQFIVFRCQEEMSQQVEAIQPDDDTRLVIQKFKVAEEIQHQ